jgi:hypothetical protein
MVVEGAVAQVGRVIHSMIQNLAMARHLEIVGAVTLTMCLFGGGVTVMLVLLGVLFAQPLLVTAVVVRTLIASQCLECPVLAVL